jgi:F0F1-type ATP synthase assembly protein I
LPPADAAAPPDPPKKKGGFTDRYGYKPMGAAYQGAMESVLAIAVGTGAGYWADGYFGTRPWLLVAGATIGFAAFVLRLTRLGAALDQAASPQEPSEEDPSASRETQPGPPSD